MIRIETLISTVRFYDGEPSDPFAPFVGVATISWESPSVVWVRAMHGSFGRRQLRDLVEYLSSSGVTTVKAFRDPAKRLPFGVQVGDHVEMDVAEAVKRIDR